jgi:1-acyl-sn-glycerol-3-phosphate acyltransferase
LSGLENVKRGQPAVFISNHLRSYAPIVLAISLPLPFRPWVHAHVVSPELCRDYLEIDFVRGELRLRPPWSRMLAALIAPLCVALMRAISAIPVYKGTRRIRETFRISLETLQQGENILIFPESKIHSFSEQIHDFQTGFAELDRLYRQHTGQPLRFHPVFVDSLRREIRIGQAISLDNLAGSPVNQRKELARRLRDAVDELSRQNGEEPA